MNYETLLEQVAVIYSDIAFSGSVKSPVYNDQKQLEAFVDEYAHECHLDEDPAWNKHRFIAKLFQDYMSL